MSFNNCHEIVIIIIITMHNYVYAMRVTILTIVALERETNLQVDEMKIQRCVGVNWNWLTHSQAQRQPPAHRLT